MVRISRLLRLALLASAGVVAMAVPASAAPIAAAVGYAASMIASSAFAATLFNAAIGMAVNYGLGLLSQAMAKKPKRQGGTSVEVQFSADVARTIPFGTVASAGRRVFWKGLGKRNTKLCIVDQLADWECGGLTGVWVNGVRKTLNSVAVVGTEHARYTVTDFGTKIIVKWFRGTMTQAADSELVSLGAADVYGSSIGTWTTNHRGAGIAYVSFILEYDDNLLPSPPQLLWEFQGAKLYDWRKDSTNGGSGAHRWDDPTTWEFSSNPAVASYNYRRGFYRNAIRLGGIGVKSYNLLHDIYGASANVCDEVVSDGGGNRPRYAVSYISLDEAEHRVAIDTFATAMAGDDLQRAGQFGVIAGAAYAPVMSLSDDDLEVGEPISFRERYPIDDIYNAVHVSYINTTQPWSNDTLTPITDAGYEAQDGVLGRRARDADLAMVTNAYQARAIGKTVLEQSRMGAVHTGVYPARIGVRLEPGDWVTYTLNRDTGYGRSKFLYETGNGIEFDFLAPFALNRTGPLSYTMKVVGKRRVGPYKYELTLRQCAASNFTGPTGAITLPAAPVITAPNRDPDTPSGLTATGGAGSVTLRWANATANDYDLIQVWESATNDRSLATLHGSTRGTSYIRPNLPAGSSRYFWIRAVDIAGNLSVWHPTGSTAGVLGTSAALVSAAAGVFPVVNPLPTLPNGSYPVGSVVQLSITSELWYNKANVWTPAEPSLVVTSLSTLSANMGSLTAGLIQSPNYVLDKAGFKIDATTGAIEAMDIRVAGGTSTSRPFETRFGTIQDDVPSDDGLATVNLPKSLTGGTYIDLTGTAARRPTGIEYDITGSRVVSGVTFTGSLQGTLPRAKGIAWAPAVVKVVDPADKGNGDWYGFEITTTGDLYEFYADSASNTAPVRNLIGSFLSIPDSDPMFRGTYANTVIHVWKDVLLRGVRRIRVPSTVTVSGTPTPVVGARFWLWGAAGQGTAANPLGAGGPFAASRGGPGAYVKFDHALEAGEILSLLVGSYDGNGFGGMSVVGSFNSVDDQNIGGQGGGGSFVWRGATLRSNLLGVAGGGGSGSAEKRNGSTNVGANHGNPGGSANAGGNGVSGSEMDVCIGQSYLHGTGWRGSGGGGYVGGGYLTAAGNPGKGGTSYVIGTATSVTNSASAEDANGCSTGTTPPGTAEAAYTANSAMTWGRANVGTGSAVPGLAGPGMICIQWLT